MTYEFLIFCREMGVVLVLRPPYTTAALQGEDRRNFKLVKGGWRVPRHKKLAELIAKGRYRMGFDHFCNCLCAPWQEGFSIANNHRAWHSIGVVPFSRKVYWELVEKERAQDKACAKVDLDASKLNVQDMVQTMFGTDNREEVVDPTTQSTRLTSSMSWDKGPITFDVCFALVRMAAEERKAKEDEDVRKRQAREDEMASKKQDACVLASTLTTGLTCAEDVHKLRVEQLGAILLSRNEKKPKGKAAMVEAVVGCLGLPPVADAARSSNASPAPNVGTLASSLPPVPLLPDMSFPSFPMALDPFACAIAQSEQETA